MTSRYTQRKPRLLRSWFTETTDTTVTVTRLRGYDHGVGLTWKHGKAHIGTKQFYVFKQQWYVPLLLDTGLDLFVCFGRTESGVEKFSFWFTVLHTRTFWLMIAYIALFSALLSRLTALACGSTWVTSFIARFLNIHRSGVLTALAWLVPHETVAVSAQVLCKPYNHALCYFMQSHLRKVYACLAVTCHLHFWQNDRDLLRATAVTRGWNGYRNKSQHRKSTLEKKILPPLQQGFEPVTFQSRVRRSNHWAIPAVHWNNTLSVCCEEYKIWQPNDIK